MTNMNRKRNSGALAKAAALGVALAVLATGQQALAGSREQARRMYDRLTGTPPSPALLADLEGRLGATPTDASRVATALYILDRNAEHSKYFYSVTLKNFASPWTNRDQSIFAPLNDYSATVIGMVRDDVDFRGVLSEDIVYVGQGTTPAYSPTSNAHYDALEGNSVDLRTALTRTTQSSLNGLPPSATAGVITSRAGAEAFFIDGTNRAMFRFTLLNHMCRDLEQVHDTTRPPDRIRQDVTRSPGGDSSVFNNNCIGCHSVMDSMAQAFAFYDFDETVTRLVYTPGQVQPKYLINSDNFKPGYVTPNDAWENRMRLPGKNTHLGWDQSLPNGGNGAKSLGTELARSDAFAQCQVEKVFRAVCFRSPVDQDDRTQVEASFLNFKNNGGDLRRVFAETAVYCSRFE
ncbi:MAG: hypothetical protein ABW171_07175 [Steroidobacter sp.]